MRAFGLVRALAQNLKNNLGWTGIVVFSIFPPIIPISFLICGLIDLCALPYTSAANHGVLRQQTMFNNYRGYYSSGSPYHSPTMRGYYSTPAVQYPAATRRSIDFTGQSSYSPSSWHHGTSHYQSSSHQGTSQNGYQSSSRRNYT